MPKGGDDLEKKGRGRPSKPKNRGHQIRYGRIYDDFQLLIPQFESESDIRLIKNLLDSYRPKDIEK
ncbi:Uncharacterised protein [Mycobacteroides abscessus subsp. abscessus]|nr:Uncharacterised protein [Mycobacteroides abscessus subsp. abscessus]